MGAVLEASSVPEDARTWYARDLERQLGEHSVKVLAIVRLAQLLPPDVAEPHLADLRQTLTERVSRLSPVKLSRAAESLRASEGTYRSERDRGVGGLAVLIVMAAVRERSVEADLSAPFMEEILLTGGLFAFPNPVLKKDLLNDIRATME
ncbi:MAG: hypothetical protein AAGA87_14400 [Pseudomonadota bacterium]